MTKLDNAFNAIADALERELPKHLDQDGLLPRNILGHETRCDAAQLQQLEQWFAGHTMRARNSALNALARWVVQDLKGHVADTYEDRTSDDVVARSPLHVLRDLVWNDQPGCTDVDDYVTESVANLMRDISRLTAEQIATAARAMIRAEAE